MKRYTTRIECECDGNGPCTGTETRVFPLGAAGNLILCRPCFEHEAKEHGTGKRWDNAEVYTSEIEGAK